jgi:hypothetical protein
MCLGIASGQAEVSVSDLFGQRPGVTIPYWTPINRENRRNLCTTATEECLVCHIQFSAINLTFDHSTGEYLWKEGQ